MNIRNLIVVGSLLIGAWAVGYAGSPSRAEDTSQFADVVISTSPKKTLSMETLWEVNMLVDGAGDANENDHNLFVIDDVVYAYVEKFVSAFQGRIILHKYNAQTGESISDNVWSGMAFPTEIDKTGNFPRMLMTDDAGHIVIVGYKDTTSDSTKDFDVYVYAYDKDTAALLSSVTASEDAESAADHLMKGVEWLGCSGDVTTGNFNFRVGGWHTRVSRGNSMNNYCASECIIAFENNQLDAPLTVTRYASGPDGYQFTGRNYGSLAQNIWTDAYLFVADIDSETHLVQAFGTATAPTTPSSLLLYKTKDHSSGGYPTMEWVSELKDEELSDQDEHCYGAYPVRLDDETLLVMPYKFGAATGTKFNVARWTDLSTLENGSLTKLWQFPTSTYPIPASSGIYYNERPKVVVKNLGASEDDGTVSAIVYAYMPESILGAYKITLTEEKLSAITALTPSDVTTIAYSLQGNTLRIDGGQCSADYEINLYSMTGQQLLSKRVAGSATVTEDLSSIGSGVYVLQINGNASKIVLK